MTFPKDIADHHKENLTQKCFYLVNLFKAKDSVLWEKYKARLATLKPEDSWDFYHELLVEYQKLVDKPDLPKEEAPQTAKPAKAQKPVAKPVAKPAPKAAAKAPAKKVAKKAPAKKAAKKVAKKAAKKAAPKKAAKKVAKKAAPKKAAKKVAKKAAPKKAAKKKAKK